MARKKNGAASRTRRVKQKRGKQVREKNPAQNDAARDIDQFRQMDGAESTYFKKA